MAKRPPGRPPRIDDEPAKERLLDALRLGVGYKDACARAPYGYSALMRDLALAIEHEEADEASKYRDLRDRILRARADGNIQLAASARRSAIGGPIKDKDGNVTGYLQPDGKLALEMLARRDPDNWGRTDRHVVRASIEPLQVEIIMSDVASGDDAPESEPSGT